MRQVHMFFYILSVHNQLNMSRIGITTNLRKRIFKLQQDSEEQLVEYDSWMMPTHSLARALVQKIGRKLAHLRQGDLYQIEPSIMSLGAKAMASQLMPTAEYREAVNNARRAQELEWVDAGKVAWFNGEPIGNYPKEGKRGSRLRHRAKVYWTLGWRLAQQTERED